MPVRLSALWPSLCCPPASPNEKEMGALISDIGMLCWFRALRRPICSMNSSWPLNGPFSWRGMPRRWLSGPALVRFVHTCPEDGRCRFPEKARPSLEACGVDVYRTAHNAGLPLSPVSHPQGYVKYVGLVLFDKKGSHASPAGPGSLDA